MKKTVIFLKAVALFITAVWGIIFGILFPLTWKLNIAEGSSSAPLSVPNFWIIVSIFGFILPCFLVMFKLYKISASVSIIGAIALFVLHAMITKEKVSEDMFYLYLPLIFETIALILIAVFANMGEIRIKLYEKEKARNAPAPSVLGENPEYNKPVNAKRKKKK